MTDDLAGKLEEMARETDDNAANLEADITPGEPNFEFYRSEVARKREHAETLRSAASALRGEWRPTHRHAGRGKDYQLIGTALLQWSPQLGDMDPVTIYRDEHGQTWVRGSDEFNDGRFEPLPPPPTGEGK